MKGYVKYLSFNKGYEKGCNVFKKVCESDVNKRYVKRVIFVVKMICERVRG